MKAISAVLHAYAAPELATPTLLALRIRHAPAGRWLQSRKRDGRTTRPCRTTSSSDAGSPATGSCTKFLRHTSTSCQTPS